MSTVDVSTVGGNASQELKQSLVDLLRTIDTPNNTFESDIASRIEWTEFSVMPKAEEPERPEGRVVAEITVTEDMLNAYGIVHGACHGLLIDNCSTMPIALLGLATTGKGDLGVTQALHVLYHAPAMLGDRLRIVSTTISLGGRALSSRCEIWNVTQHRLVSSGVHTKMSASTPSKKSKL